MSDTSKPGTLPSFEDLLVGVAGQSIATQQRLDTQYLERLRDFAAFVPVSPISGLFAPARLAIQTQSVELAFTSVSESLREIRILNQVVSKRYRSQQAAHTVRFKVLRSPVAPGKDDDPK